MKKALAVAFLAVLPTLFFAQISTFDTSNEGWTADGDAQNGAAYWLGNNGNPGGCIEGIDNATGITWYFVAPSCYLGNKTAVYGQFLDYDFRTTSIGTAYATGDIILQGANGTTLLHEFGQPAQQTWKHYQIPFIENEFRVGSLTGPTATQAEMQAVLANLAVLKIRGEYYAGADIGYLDNVKLGELPSYPLNQTICRGDTFFYGNQSFTQSGDYDFLFQNSLGCDSANVHLSLVVLDSTLVRQSVSICSGERFELADGSFVEETGLYRTVFQKQNGCDSTFLVDLKMHPTGDTTLFVELHEGENFTLPDGSATVRDTFLEQIFNLKTAFGCDSTVRLRLKTIFYRVFFPNIFSPDDDGLNDFWLPSCNAEVKNIRSLQVFDRWGNLVFEQKNAPPNDLRGGWDGRVRGKKVEPSVFTWLAEVEFFDDATERFSGSLTVSW